MLDAVFLQKELDDGLTRQEIIGLIMMLDPEALMVPINTTENSSSANGFVTLDGLDKIEGNEEMLLGFVQDILGDMDKEKPDGMYEIEGELRLWIGYDVPGQKQGEEEHGGR